MDWGGSGCLSIGVMIAPPLGDVVYAKGRYYVAFARCFGLLAVDIYPRPCTIEVKEMREWLPDCDESVGSVGRDGTWQKQDHPDTRSAVLLSPEQTSGTWTRVDSQCGCFWARPYR